jgi:primosomal protein N' (replication factor Y)
MIADVVFDVPVTHPFSYRVPPGLSVAPGQRVRAELGRQTRVGLVVAVREGDEQGLRPIQAPAESGPILSSGQLELTRWIERESLSSWGSTVMALLPPVPRLPGETTPVPAAWPGGQAPRPRLLVGGSREPRLLARLKEEVEAGSLLVLAPEIDDAGAWGARLETTLQRPVVRLDSSVPERRRWSGWMALARGEARVAVGTRSALLAPALAPATLVLLDEHDPAHKPPGPPRIHSREVARERARREGSLLYLTSATPSVESWWRADDGQFEREGDGPAPWPRVSVVDVRGTLRIHPLSPVLRQAMRETLAARGQVLLLVSRTSSAMACGECGHVFRCSACGIAMSFSRTRRQLVCRLCRRFEAAPDACAHCRGRRLAPLGWGTERVEQAVRERFRGVQVTRYDRESGPRPSLHRATTDGRAQVVVGTRSALKAFAPRRPALVGFITPDPILRLPDFRATERAFSLLWAAAERVAEGGRVVIQTQHPGLYAIQAVVEQDLMGFYKHELRFRAELGYPPFRRLCVITVAGGSDGAARWAADELARELATLGGVTVYPPAPLGRSPRAPRWQIILKGPDDLSDRVAAAVAPFRRRRPAARGIIDVEMDPTDLV